MNYGGLVFAIVLGFGSLALWIAYRRECKRKAQNREIADALERRANKYGPCYVYEVTAAIAALRGEL